MTKLDLLQDELNHQYNLLKTIASVYLTVHEINLLDNTFYECTVSSEVKEYLKIEQDAAIVMKKIFSEITEPEFRLSTLAFTDLSTLKERMKDEKVIVHEYRGKHHGWIRAKFIVSERDTEGYPTKVIHTTEIIEKQKRKEEELTRMSFNDEMTHLYNRRAYERDIKYLDLNMNDTVIYISIDLNGLKNINDAFGHLEGDKAIKGAAICIFNTFGEYGNCYRVGGDEFAVIIKCPNDFVPTLMKGFKDFLDFYNAKRQYKIKMSIGHASNTDDLINDVSELISLADKRMYEEKDKFYEANKQLVRRNQ